MKETSKQTQWSLFFNFLNYRTRYSLRNPKYVMYFIFIIFLVGSFGLIHDIININYCLSCDFDPEKVKAFAFNMTNMSLSLVTASVIDLIFISRKSIEEENKQQSNGYEEECEHVKGNVRFFGLSSLIFTFILWILVNDLIENNSMKIILATFSLLFSYWIWWISNVKNKILSEGKQPPESIIGGPINPTPTPPTDSGIASGNDLNGSIQDFKV